MRKSRKSTKNPSKKLERVIKKKKKSFARKQRKAARELRAMGIHKKPQKKGLSVPNLCPFKEDLLRKALRQRHELKQELSDRRKEKKNRKELVANATKLSAKERKMGYVFPKAYLKSHRFDASNKANFERRLPRNNWEHKHFYFRELNQVIESSDVLIQVLDARDPMGCRSKAMERKIIGMQSLLLGTNKKLIILLNKIDLIPGDVLNQWLKLLRREFPVIAFKASTQSQKRKLHSNINFSEATKSDKPVTNRAVGTAALMSLLKNYARSLNLKTPITVGLFGYPNTGKSSVINSLKRTQAVGTAAMPGFTTNLQQVRLDSNLKLIDSPGVILNNSEVETRLVLRNALKLQDIDAIATVKHILRCVPNEKIAAIYGINNVRQLVSKQDESMGDTERFLCAMSVHMSHLKSGGLPDVSRTANRIVADWNKGKIAFYVAPPAIIETDTQVKFVGSFGAAFDINALMDTNHSDAVKSIPNRQSQSTSANDRFVSVDPEQFKLASTATDADWDFTNGNEMLDDDMDMDMDFDIKDENDGQLQELSELQSSDKFKRRMMVPNMDHMKEGSDLFEGVDQTVNSLSEFMDL